MTTVLITGATGGLGRPLAASLTAEGATVLVHGRDQGNREQLVHALRAQGGRAQAYGGDLAVLADVAELAERVAAEHPELDVLVNNAGVGFGAPGAARELTRDGNELRFAVNYLAPVLLTRRLLDTLGGNPGARIVNVGSIGQADLDLTDPQSERDYDGTLAYRRSKLALVMFTIDLADELAGRPDAARPTDGAAPPVPTVNVLHPETLMDTTMVRDAEIAPRSSVSDGVANVLALLHGPAASGVTGQYFDRDRHAEPLAQARDQSVRAELRALTDQLLRPYLR
jgi:NAD(P)-dependent dehydrogenase (short-subunit alcohol dehydrogenase family)